MDKLIREGLKKRLGALKIDKTGKCPSETKLSKYLEGLLSKEEERTIAGHIADCYWCIEQLDQAQRARLRTGVKSKIVLLNLINWIKRNKWLVGAGITFLLSFIFSRYFLQFLILTLLMGIKWIFTTGGSKTVVMIYDAWKRRSKEDRHTHLKNRF